MLPSVGATGRGRGRGRASNRAGASSARVAMPRGQSTPRAASVSATQGNATGSTHGAGSAFKLNGFTKQPSRSGRGAFANSSNQSQGSWQQRFDKLETHRKRERADAIANGIIADPDRPRALSQALTPTATCTDMCPEFERMQRGTQNDVWLEEKDLSQPGVNPKDAPAVETKMVKKFRRAAAGIEEQLPSDLRTPHVLSQTCDYLFNDIVANAPELGRVHHFVWDRTRAIRNDFTILQVSIPEDLTYAVDCLERIARFHILSLHQMAGVREKDFQYDWQQDREQLDRTLVSLMQYYDDSRGKIPLPNEPEFRAYLIIFQLQDPDMEDRVQSWPQDLVQHPRIRKAMKLYAAAGDTSSLQGPLRPPATLPIAQQDWQRFWNLVASKRTSYLTACVAEINFNLTRRVALQALTRSVNQRATADFTVEELCTMLGFNDGFEAEDYLACYNLTFHDRDEGRFADISALKSRQTLPEPSPKPPNQLKSDMVEAKRFGRSLPAVISGFSVKEAQDNGMVDEDEMELGDADMEEGGAGGVTNNYGSDDTVNDGESLFMPDTAKSKPSGSTFGVDVDTPTASIFGLPTQQTKAETSFFGKPSAGTFGNPSSGGDAAAAPVGPAAALKSAPFSFLPGTSVSSGAGSIFSSTPSPAPNAFSGFGQPKSKGEVQESTKTPSFTTKKDTSSSIFGGFNFTPSTEDAASQTAPAITAPPFGQPKQNASSSFFSQQPKSTGPPKPFVEDGSDPSPSSSPQRSEFSAVTSPPALSSEKAALPAFSFTAPKTDNAAPAKPTPNPTSLFAKPEEGAKQPSATPSLLPETPAATSLVSSNTESAPPPKPASTPSFSFSPNKDSTASARRGSGSENFNRPAKPSPLAQSFTAGIDAADVDKPTFSAPVKSGTKQVSSYTGASEAHQQNKLVKHKLSLAEPDFATIIRDIARSITLTSDIGLFDQFMEFHLGKIVTDIQEEVHFERINAQADEHRASVLQHRYGRLWRDVCRRRRLARQGRERRKRNQQRLLECRSQASETPSPAGSVLGNSQFGSTVGMKLSRQEEVDKMFQQSTSSGRWSRMAKQDEQAKGGSKRPTSSHSMEPPAGSRDTGHKRLKSTSHVDNSGRITKSAPTSHPSTGALKRSSFRETLPDNPPVASTTKSNYFRLKAMGRAHVYDLAPTHPRKRHHAEVTSSPASSLRQQSVTHSPLEEASPPASKLRRMSCSSVQSRHTAEETNAIIARARAAREALRDGSAQLQSVSDTGDPLRQSTGSQVLYESPSLERARLDARWRASQSTDFGSSHRSDVPAYRLRESKFVPREHYAHAIDRAREMRQSRGGSRPESRVDTHTPFKAVDAGDVRPVQTGLNTHSPIPDSTRPTNTNFGGASQPHWPTAAPSQFPTGPTPFDPATQDLRTTPSTGFGASAFGAHQPRPSGFSHSIQPSGFANHNSQPANATLGMSSTLGQPAIARTNPSYQLGFAISSADQDVNGSNDVEVTNLVDSDDEPHAENVATLRVNGTSHNSAVNGHDSEQLGGSEDEEQTFGHVNPYAALANGHQDNDVDEGDDEEEEGEMEDEEEGDMQGTFSHANPFGALADEDEDEDEDAYGQYNDEGHATGVYPGAIANGAYGDEDEDGDIEDEDEDVEDFDEDESDLDGDEDEKETDGDQYLDPGMLSQHGSALKPTTTDSEVIELSD